MRIRRCRRAELLFVLAASAGSIGLVLFSSFGCDGVLEGSAGLCLSDADCDDGLFCNGEESCAQFVCRTGMPPCPEAGGCTTCLEELDACVSGCATDADCDDGVFCNGAEVCEDCQCVQSPPPCAEDPPCSACDEEEDACIVPSCIDHSECDDGLFCNGFEMCQDCVCVSGQAPCPDVGDCVFCDEEAESCAATCTSADDCDDGLFCNGQESCDECGMCQSGQPPCDNCSEDAGCP